MKIIGIEALNKALKESQNIEPIRKVVKNNGAQMQNKAQRLAPVDTGALKRSISIDLQDGGFTAKVSPGVDYAAYQEYGTRFQSGTPFMRPSFRSQQPMFISDLKRLMGK
ncbi:MAG: HK97 gp10 family phage protein [Staphylococcus equorum]|nr:HK97 gp10 family phage protein [Staphylococcus equorum]